MTTKLEGHYAKQSYIVKAVNSHSFTIDMSDTITAEIQRFDSSMSFYHDDRGTGTAGTAVSYGVVVSGTVVVFSTLPEVGGTAILIVKGRL